MCRLASPFRCSDFSGIFSFHYDDLLCKSTELCDVGRRGKVIMSEEDFVNMRIIANRNLLIC